jgi:predicted nucleic acid-binding protein
LNAVLIDTSVIVALLDRSEQRHVEYVQLYRQLDSARITCDAVVAGVRNVLRNLANAAQSSIRGDA